MKPHDQYLALGTTEDERCSAYRDMFQAHVDDVAVSDIRASWQTGTPLGNDRFREQIEAVLNRKVGYSRRGRPVKSIKGL